MQPTEQLAVSAAALERVAPHQWREFLKALAVYNEIHRNNLVKSPIAELAVNQGRAQSLSSLLEILDSSASLADKIGKRK